MVWNKALEEERAQDDLKVQQLIAEAKKVQRGTDRAFVMTEEHMRDMTVKLKDGRCGVAITYFWLVFLIHGWGEISRRVAANYIELATHGELSAALVKQAIVRLEEVGLIETELVGCGKSKFQTKQITLKHQPVMSSEVARRNVIRPEIQEIMDYYREKCGALGPKGYAVNKMQTSKNIARVLKLNQGSVAKMKELIDRYRASPQFKPDWVYKISNFFGEKAYWESYKPVSILSDADAARSAANCEAKLTTEYCEWQLGVKDFPYCGVCDRRRRGKAKW